MSDEREALGPLEARQQPTPVAFESPGPPLDDSLQELTRDLERAGQTRFAARLATLVNHLDASGRLLPQMGTSEPVPERALPELKRVEETS